jgi:hypothetical protein
VEPPAHRYHWVAAGEASLWTTRALSDFCNFTYKAFANKHVFMSTLRQRFLRTQASVVDMSLLWLWWVAHNHRSESILVRSNLSATSYFPSYLFSFYGSRQHGRDLDNALADAVRFASALPLPDMRLSFVLRLCNGMLVVNNSVFDHMHGWRYGEDFSFNVERLGFGNDSASLRRRETEETGVQLRPFAVIGQGLPRLYFHNLHYQGDSKKAMVLDLCRLLHLLHALPSDETVRLACRKEIGAESCVKHTASGSHKVLCF